MNIDILREGLEINALIEEHIFKGNPESIKNYMDWINLQNRHRKIPKKPYTMPRDYSRSKEDALKVVERLCEGNTYFEVAYNMGNCQEYIANFVSIFGHISAKDKRFSLAVCKAALKHYMRVNG